MRHMARIKKKPKLNTFMLHSKSTYFYKQRWNSYLVPAMCALALLLVMGLCISPLTPNSESAYADTATLDNASLKLTVGSTNLAKPDAKAGEVNYITTSVNVNAANVDGYKVYVQAAPGNSAVLRNGNTEITGVGDNIAVTNFENNKWGYALDSTGASVESLTYTSVPENSAILNPAYTTNAASEEKNFNLAFAAKFGTDATAGHYSTNVLLSAVASAKEVAIFDEPTGFNGIMNMQDMTSAVCSGAAEGTSGRLRDTRDMKVYWVTKINNSCWMTQNLDLDLDENINLTSADTDINNAVTLATTQTDAPNFSNSAGTVQSFDPGYYVYSAVSPTGACSSTNLSNCNGFTNILNGIWESSNDPNFTGAVDDSTKTYNAHYLVGNYYSYAAATAGAGPSNEGVASGSICPKGWRLPTGGNNTGEFYNTFVGTASANAIIAPHYLTYSGYAIANSLDYAGNWGGYWSSVSSTDSFAYNLFLANNALSTTGNNASGYSRQSGMSVRCIARSEPLTNITYMQDMAAGVCASSKEGDSKKLIDRRDSKSYQVTKLKDGNCWMTENLNIINKTIDSAYSDMTSGSFTIPASNISGFTTSDQNQPKAYSDSTYGGYYNYYTATAGSGNASFSIGNAPNSICPRNWRLPTGGSNAGQFYSLLNGLTADTLTSSPYNFKYSGSIDNGRQSTGTQGIYRTSTTDASTHAFWFAFGSSITPFASGYRYPGYAIRCVAR